MVDEVESNARDANCVDRPRDAVAVPRLRVAVAVGCERCYLSLVQERHHPEVQPGMEGRCVPGAEFRPAPRMAGAQEQHVAALEAGAGRCFGGNELLDCHCMTGPNPPEGTSPGRTSPATT